MTINQRLLNWIDRTINYIKERLESDYASFLDCCRYRTYEDWLVTYCQYEIQLLNDLEAEKQIIQKQLQNKESCD